MIKPNAIFTEFKKDLKGKTGRQTATLYLTQIIALFLGIFTGIINTRVLGRIFCWSIKVYMQKGIYNKNEG